MQGPAAGLPASFLHVGPSPLRVIFNPHTQPVSQLTPSFLATPLLTTPLPSCTPFWATPHPAIPLLLPQSSDSSLLQPRYPIPPPAGLPGFSLESPAFLSFSPPLSSPFPKSYSSCPTSPPDTASCLQLPLVPPTFPAPPSPRPCPCPPGQPTPRKLNCHWLTPLQDSAPSAFTSAIAAERRPSVLSPGNAAGSSRAKSSDYLTA